jgi:Mn2+/Fe2+ NRAMP family transporter
MLVASLGTTISPYLFFWQASQELEEEKDAGQSTPALRRGATVMELDLRNLDVGAGAFFSNMVMFFIILTTAITLNRHGLTHIETTRQAAEALRPLAGNFAAVLFTTGIVGVGFLAIPTLAGSAAYAFAETLGWHQGLNKKMKQARAFYVLILLSTGMGVGLDFVGINPVKALYWTAVINGLLAPFLLIAILVVASDKKLMQGQPSSRLGWIVVALTTAAMFVAGVAMFVVLTAKRILRSPVCYDTHQHITGSLATAGCHFGGRGNCCTLPCEDSDLTVRSRSTFYVRARSSRNLARADSVPANNGRPLCDSCCRGHFRDNRLDCLHAID